MRFDWRRVQAREWTCPRSDIFLAPPSGGLRELPKIYPIHLSVVNEQMSDKDDHSPQESPPAPAPRVWYPPRIRTGQLFESNSLACFKASNAMLECGQNPPWAS